MMIHARTNLFVLRMKKYIFGIFGQSRQAKAHFSAFWQGDGSTFFTLLALSNEATVFDRLGDMHCLPSDY
jgi:hypothetical protein